MTKRELTPTFEKYISVIAEREKSDAQGLNTVLRILKNEIEPQLSRMTKSQLVEAFAEAIYAIYCTDQWLEAQEASTEHYRRDALRRRLSYGRLQAELEKAPEKERKRFGKMGGSADKKDKSEALKLWICWGKNPGMFKNKTAFCNKLTENIPGKNYPYCSPNTSQAWFKYFRENHPQPSIENLLPKK